MQPEELPGLICRPVTTAEDRRAALALNARVYTERGIVTSEDDDFIHDRWVDQSIYFGAFYEGEMVGTSRLIPYQDDLHMFELFELEPGWKAKLREVPLYDNAYEVSALSVPKTAPGGFFSVSAGLYRSMFHYSLAEQRYVWLAGLTPMLGRILNKVLGIPLQVIGPKVEFAGATRMPGVIDLIVFLEYARTHAPHEWEFFTRGLEIDVREEIEAFVDTRPAVSFR